MTDTCPACGATPCPDDEDLVALATSHLAPARQADLDQHLDACDRCLETLTFLERRLMLTDEIAMPVPAAVVARAGFGPPARAVGEPVPVPWLERLRAWLAPLFHWPTLVPVAATALLALVLTQTLRPGSDTARELTRSVATQSSLRVAAREARVFVKPSTRAAVVATLTRGASVDVRSVDRDWYEIALPDGTGGWVERHAFE